jgi:hypothetical protein
MTDETSVKKQHIGENFALYNVDNIDGLKGIPSDSIHYSIFSPPFCDLFVYGNNPRDVGNNITDEEFYAHMKFLTAELYRVLMPGRDLTMHCMDLPSSKQRDGMIGLRDFSGGLIRMMQDAGFIYHSRVVIWKNPVTAMQRTKALGLLWKQVKKDSCMSRQGIPDYMITFRKPGENPEPVSHTPEDYPVDKWQQIASPVWMDINQSNTLQRESAREEADEKHACPTQLDALERCIELWSNPGDIVLDPFVGIGSSVYQALLMGRRGIGFELKDSYYQQAVLNCKRAESDARAPQVGLDQWVGTSSGQSKLEV